MSEVNYQTEGPMDVPSQSAKDLWQLEASGSSPSHFPSWSPARGLPSSCPNTKHCLEIWVTLTKEWRAVPPPSHSWMAPLVEDMLWDIRTGLTKAVVIGPGRAVLVYGRCSLGEGLTQTRLEMPHSYSLEEVCWLENWPTLLLNPWQSKKVDEPLPKL